MLVIHDKLINNVIIDIDKSKRVKAFSSIIEFELKVKYILLLNKIVGPYLVHQRAIPNKL